MQFSFLLVFILNVVGVSIGVWARAPTLSKDEDTVLKYEPHLAANEDNLTLLFPEFNQLYPPLHKPSDVNGKNLKFDFMDCGNDFSTIRFLNLTVAPSPVVTPGKLTISFQVEFKEEIKDTLKATMKLSRKLGPGSITIPCIGNIGSCVYDHFCKRLEKIKECPKPFVEYGFNCRCPIKKGVVTVPPVDFIVRKSSVPSGQYTAVIMFYHREAFAGCLKATISFSTP